MSKFEFEKKKLYSIIGDNLVDELKGQQCYVAGGTITSLFCNRDVNDLDVYFKSDEAFVEFITSIWGDAGWIVAKTDKATLIKMNSNKEVQMIHFKYFPKAEDIFETFDFTVCMGAFDFETEEFVLHPDFLQHNSQRILRYNANTAFPIVSLLRVQKYKEKGYGISKPEMIRIALSCMNLDINTYEELKEQLGGMYGVNYDKLFTDCEGEVDLVDAMEKIQNLHLDDDYFKTPQSFGEEVGDLDEFLDDIIKSNVKYFEIEDQVYRIAEDGGFRASKSNPRNGVKVDSTEYLREKKFYKYVRKDKGKYYSFYDKGFEYSVDKEVVAKSSLFMGSKPSLYFNEFDELDKSTYRNEIDGVVIEVSFNPEDFIRKGTDGVVTLGKCTMIREVPIQEIQCL